MALNRIGLATGLLTKFQPSTLGVLVLVQLIGRVIGVLATYGAPKATSTMNAAVPPSASPLHAAKPWPSASDCALLLTPTSPSFTSVPVFVSSYQRMLGHRMLLPGGSSKVGNCDPG